MNNYDYVVLIDENGQPYIAHSLWGNVKSSAKKAYGSAKSTGRRATKYIEKIGEGAKARYFYTQDELKAYYNKGKNAAKNAANKAVNSARDALGYTARDAVDKAIRDYGKANRDHNTAKSQLDGNQLDYAVAASAAARAHTNEVANAGFVNQHIAPIFSKKAKEKNETIKKAAEATEAERIKKSRELGRMQEIEAVRSLQEKEAKDAWEKAIDTYEKTPLAKIDSFIKSAKDLPGDIKDWANERVDDAKEAVGFDARANVEDAEIASGAATHNWRLAYDRFQKASKDLDDARAAYKENRKDKSLRDEYDKAREELHEASLDLDRKRNADNNADRNLADAKASYASTPLGKAENAVNTVKEKASEVKEITASQARKLQEKLASGKELAQNEMNQLMTFLMKGYK